MTFLKIAITLALCALAPAAFAEDAYFHVPVPSLTFVGRGLPPGSTPTRWQTAAAERPYAALDGEGEVYIDGVSSPWGGASDQEHIAVRAPKGKEITGRLFVRNPETNGLIALKFKLAAQEGRPEARAEFLKAKEDYYR